MLNHFKDHDELYLNVIGTGFTVPIDRASVSVHGPGPLTARGLLHRPAGSRTCLLRGGQVGQQRQFSQSNLDAGLGHDRGGRASRSGWCRAPNRSSRRGRVWPGPSPFGPTRSAPRAGSWLVVIVGFGIARLSHRPGPSLRRVSRRCCVRQRRWRRGARAACATATRSRWSSCRPTGSGRARSGTLIDEQANPLDVTATIIDLAVRGYLKITEIPKEGWFGKPDWQLAPAQGRRGAHALRGRAAHRHLQRRPGRHAVGLKNHFATRLKSVENLALRRPRHEGWYSAAPRPHPRAYWHGVGIGVLVAGVGRHRRCSPSSRATDWSGVPIVVAGLLFFVGSRWFPRRTAKGYGALRRVLGFKRFIDESEKDRARFAEQQHLFSEYLPYAVVFGATEKWARAFAGLDGQLPQQNWYIGPGPFTFLAFSSAMDSFAVTSTGTISSVPASSGSSGFGGGGFSGGGFGGGGGAGQLVIRTGYSIDQCASMAGRLGRELRVHVLEGLDQDPTHRPVAVPLVVGRHDVPRAGRRRRSLDGVGVRLHVVVPLPADLEIGGQELPPLRRVSRAGLGTARPARPGDVQIDLDDRVPSAVSSFSKLRIAP